MSIVTETETNLPSQPSSSAGEGAVPLAEATVQSVAGQSVGPSRIADDPAYNGVVTPQKSQTPPGEWPREAVITAWAILAAGAFFRIWAFAHWRALWLDEIYIAHSVVTRGFWGLLSQPLDYWQAAPPGFLVLERLCVDLFGVGERVLRIPSFVAGLAALPLFYWLARRTLSLRGTLLAVLLFASLQPLIYYSEELKQYSIDVVVLLAIVLSAVRSYQALACRQKQMVYAIVGAIGIFFSHPAIFVLAGTAPVLLFTRIMRARREKLPIFSDIGPLFGAVVVLAALEAVNFVFFLRPLLHGNAHIGLMHDWETVGGFPPYLPNRAIGWIWRSFRGVMAGTATMWITAADLALVTAIVGTLGLLGSKKRSGVGALVFATLPVAMLAAFMRKYPFADRLALYSVPILALLIAAGIDFIWGAEEEATAARGASRDGFKRMALGLLIMFMVIGDPAMRSAYVARNPSGREETKELYQWIRRNWRDGDAMWISHNGLWSFDYYAPKAGMAGLEQLWPSAPDAHANQPMLEAGKQGAAAEPWFINAFTPKSLVGESVKGYVILEPDHSANPALYLDDVDHIFQPPSDWRWPPVKRVWVVFAHDWDERTDKLCLPELDRRAHLSIQHTEDGATVYLYEATDTPSAYLRP